MHVRRSISRGFGILALGALVLSGFALGAVSKPSVIGVITAMSQSNGGETPTETFTISGKNFEGVTAVTLGGHPLTFTVVSSTEITGTIVGRRKHQPIVISKGPDSSTSTLLRWASG